LWREGYLVFKELPTGMPGQGPTIAGEVAVPLTTVDWSRSRAYSVGCGKIYLNLQGREGQGVVAEGSMNGDGEFTATNVLAKHDENYIPKEVVDALKAQGEWRPEAGGQ